MKFSLPSAAIAWSALLLSNLSLATPVSITTGYQTVGNGFFSGSIDYSATSSTTARLTLILNNLSTTAVGGRITGVALNAPNGVNFSSMTGSGPNSNFGKIDPSNNQIRTTKLGNFDFGSAIGGSWLEDSSLSSGIAAGSSGTFVFNFVGKKLDSLSTLSFINAVAPSNSSPSSQFIAVRFTGFTANTNNGRSSSSSESSQLKLFDEVGGNIASSNPPPVPVPASVWLMLSGLGGLGFISRKRKSAM